MTSFIELGLAQPLLKALEGEGYTTPTPIQSQAIPIVLAGRDLVGIAQTGTGKTAAFALPILHRLAASRRPALRKGCRVLVLSPTRELASQIAESFRTYGRHMGLSVAVVFGGVGHRPQIQALARGVDVLVATPGRLLDHMGARDIDVAGSEILVLDEADQMLDLGFIKPIRQIVSRLSTRRQTLLFSATMPDEIASLAREMLSEPERVAVTPVAKTADRVAQRVIHVETSRKRALLAELVVDPAMARTLVFTRTKRGADRVARHLESAGVSVAAIHGNKSQSQREKALEAFRAAEIRVLVATDIAARGIDIDGISHVINFELPEVPEIYVHRIGRTARAGAEGEAITLCDREEQDLLRRIERLTRQTIAAESRVADAALAADAPAARERRGRGNEGRDRGAPPRREPRRMQVRGDRRGDRDGRTQDSRPREDRPREDRQQDDRPRETSAGAARRPEGAPDRDNRPRTDAPARHDRPGARPPRNAEQAPRRRSDGERRTEGGNNGRARGDRRGGSRDGGRSDDHGHVPAFLRRDSGANPMGGPRHRADQPRERPLR